MKYVNLHSHTIYSLLDGVCQIEELVQRAKELEMPALAITDHGNLAGSLQFVDACNNLKIKPILGCELYIVNDKLNREKKEETGKTSIKTSHQIILAKNNEGWKNLLYLTNDAVINGFYYKPRTDFKTLAKYRDNIIVSTSCMIGAISKLIRNKRTDLADKMIRWYKKTFEDNFFIELQLNDIEEQVLLNIELLKFAKKYNIKYYISGDIHYVLEEHSKIQNILLLIRQKKTLEDLANDKEKKIWQFKTNQLWLKSVPELLVAKSRWHKYLMPDQFHQALMTTLEIADMCEPITFSKELKMPEFDSGKINNFEFLSERCKEGIWNKELTNDKYQKRLLYELGIIKKLNLSGYFLILWDMMNWVKRQNILAGYGRGSSSGSLICYLLGITNVDPIKFNLIFERFVSMSRKGLPDVDLDFDARDRDKIKEYLLKKYGNENVVSISVYGMMNFKSAVKDISGVLNVSYPEVNYLTKNLGSDIDSWHNEEEGEEEAVGFMSREDIIEKYPIINEYAKKGKKFKDAIDLAFKIRRTPKFISVHPAGVIVTKDSIMRTLPVTRRAGAIVTAWNEGTYRKELTTSGFLKIDILGLRTLSYIKDCFKLIKKYQDKEIDLNMIENDLKQDKVYEMFRAGKTAGVFQFDGYKVGSLLDKVKPTEFNDLVAINALGRPGPADVGMDLEYASRKHGKKFEYSHPIVKNVLSNTYGIIVYQEDIMGLASALANFTPDEADDLRKVLLKVPKSERKTSLVIEKKSKLQNKFISNSIKNGVEKRKAEKLWEQMHSSVRYSFNRSHAVAYAMLGYACMYLKAFYPLEFFAALLKYTNDRHDRFGIFEEVSNSKIKIRKVNINKSKIHFSIYKDSILFGLSDIKHIGEKAAIEIIKKRPYNSYHDFMDRVEKRKANKKVVINLILHGAFGNDKDRKMRLLRLILNDEEKLKEYTSEKVNEIVNENYGHYFEHGNYDKVFEMLKKDGINITRLRDVKKSEYSTLYKVVGKVLEIRERGGISKRGNIYSMQVVTITDGTALIDVTIFEDTYKKFESMIKLGKLLLLFGRYTKYKNHFNFYIDKNKHDFIKEINNGV